MGRCKNLRPTRRIQAALLALNISNGKFHFNLREIGTLFPHQFADVQAGNGIRVQTQVREVGRGERIRTSGLYVPNVALYQAKLHPDGYRKPLNFTTVAARVKHRA